MSSLVGCGKAGKSKTTNSDNRPFETVNLSTDWKDLSLLFNVTQNYTLDLRWQLRGAPGSLICGECFTFK